MDKKMIDVKRMTLKDFITIADEAKRRYRLLVSLEHDDKKRVQNLIRENYKDFAKRTYRHSKIGRQATWDALRKMKLQTQSTKAVYPTKMHCIFLELTNDIPELLK